MIEQAVRERPIIMSIESIGAILAGRKTMTRRVVKDYGDFLGAGGKVGPEWDDPAYWGWEDPRNPSYFIVLAREPGPGDVPLRCPYGQSGDHLWIKETLWVSECGGYYARRTCSDHHSPVSYEVLASDGSRIWRHDPEADNYRDRVTSWSNEGRSVGRGPDQRWIEGFELGFVGDFDPTRTSEYPYGRSIDSRHARFLKHKSSIHMPRWASRLILEITNIKVERLQSISEEDIEAEGITRFEKTTGQAVYSWYGINRFETAQSPRQAFRNLWDRLNGHHPGCSWADNPWVWSLSFKRIEI